MAIRMLSHLFSIGIVGALLFAATLNAEPPASKSQTKAHDGVLGEATDVEKTVLFQVRVYEVDHSQWAKEQGVEKRRQALDELLRPWMGSTRGSKLDKEKVKVWTTRTTPAASDIEKLGDAVRVVSEPKLAINEGRTGLFDYGGTTPQLRLFELKNGGTSESNSQVRPLATTFMLEAEVTDAERVLVSMFFNPDGQLRKNRSTNEELKKHALKAAAELSIGQTLCLSDARPESSDIDDSLLVTITPYEIVTRKVEKRIPPVAAVPTKPKELEITVDDHWPIGDIKVGQRVVAIPVTIEKTSLQADLTAFVFGLDEKRSQRVTRIEPLTDKPGRRVTVTGPFVASDEATDKLKMIVANYVDRASSASTTFVVPVSKVTQIDLYDSRLVTELFNHIPIESRPRPVELTINETFVAIGIPGLMQSKPQGTIHELGPFSLELLDQNDAGGFWRVTATKPGMARLIQNPMGDDMIGPARLTEYLVKADTRELELHIREQFPKAKVSITSLGTNSLLLTGSAESDEDSHGIVDLAQQFASKVLNRLKVGGPGRDSTWSTTRTVRPAGGPVVIEEFPPGYPDGIRVPQIPRETQFTNSPRPTTIAPSVPLPGVTAPVAAKEKGSKKSAELQQLRNEIRELRQDVRELIQRLDREPAATHKNSDDVKPAIKLGRNDLEFNKLILEYNELMEQQRFAEAEVIAKQAVELDPNNPLSQTMTFKAALARRVADKEKQRPGIAAPEKTTPNAGEPWGPAPLAHESVIENAWQMLGLRFAPLTESEKKPLPSKYLGGMRVTEVRPDSPASQNKIRKDDILVGLHVWETTNFDNLQYVLGHSHTVQHGTLKFYVVRGTETLFGELKIVKPAIPMPSVLRMKPQPRSIALSDLPSKLVTELDKNKLNVEVHRALIETALEARGITVTDDETRQFLQVHADCVQIPVDLFRQIMKQTPMWQQFLQGARQQLALVKYSGQTTEPTEPELRDAYQLAQSGRVASQQISFTDKAKADEVAREVRQNPEQFADIAAKHGQPNSFTGRTLIPSIPPNPQDEVLAKLKDGEVSDVIQVGDQFTIYQRQQLYKPPGTFEQLQPQLRATLILNKTNEIGQREVEKLRKEYRLLVVPAREPPKIVDPAAAVPKWTPSVSVGVLENAPRLSDEEQRIMRQLEKTVIVELNEPTPLREAIKQLARLVDLNIVLDQAGLIDESLTPTTLVTLHVRDVRLSTALRLLLEPLNLDFVVKHDVLQVTSRQRAAGPLTFAVYPVPDLFVPDGGTAEDLNELCTLMMALINPDSWEQVGGPATVRGNVTTNSLVVRQTQANHTRIRELLETMRTVGRRPAAATTPNTSATETNTKKSQAEYDWRAVTEKRKGKYETNNFDQQLATKVSVNFEYAPLSKVIEHLAGFAKVNIQLDQAGLEDESITATTLVSLKVSEISLRSALALLLEPLNLDFAQDADGLKVSSSQRIQGALIPVTYSVADLVCPIEGLEIQLSTKGGGINSAEKTDRRQRRHSFV